MKILLDRNIERFGVTHRTETIPRTIKWGPQTHTVSVAQRTHHQYSDGDVKVREDLSHLASICRSARSGDIEFYTSFELDMEADRHAISLKGYLGIDLLEGIPTKKVPSPFQRTVIRAAHGHGSVGTTKGEQIEFFQSIQDPRFVELNNATGNSHVSDVFHLWTAERASVDVLLTMDYKFRNHYCPANEFWHGENSCLY
jgi:hypothetical protein